MSDEELKKQINRIAIEIEKLEESAKKKEAYIKKRVNEEFDPQISEIESKLHAQQAIYDELIKNLDELTSKKKELDPIVKDLKKKYDSLKKNKEKVIDEKLKAIAKEKKIKTKAIDREIKLLEKELKAG